MCIRDRGKPKDEIEARKMITSLSGRTHQVITGISLINLDNNKKIIDYVISNVKFKNLSEEDINDYIKMCIRDRYIRAGEDKIRFDRKL